MKEFSFWLITDTHFFKNSLGAWGEGYNEFMSLEQKCFAETETIDRAVISFLMEDRSADTVLIAGDLSFNGEKESHEEFSRLLGQLKDSGKRIFVVTAGHDCAEHPFCFPGTAEKQPAEGVSFDELLDYYHEFGYDQAIAFNREHMSYVAQLSEGVRLLVLCNDTAQGRALEYDDEFYGWIVEQCQQAQRDGQL
ncbi:MAG: metallophosphoesterase, partial [Clostridia bacterium]|nr:metallophosphoesterase [Clostridia bacterium]